MVSSAAPPPIPGTAIDPPPLEVPEFAEKLDRNPVGSVAYRSLRRYQHANIGLLANGTAYFLLLSLLSVLAFTYGLITVIGADALADWLTRSLAQALPGLVGDNGIDPDVLRSTGRTAGIVGLVFLLYGGLGSVNAAGSSMHLIYGAPPDPRKFLQAKVRQLGMMLLMGPLMLISLAGASLTTAVLARGLDAIGLESSTGQTVLRVVGIVLGFGLDYLIIWLLLGWLGGIRPEPHPRRIGALVGAVLVAVIKGLLSLIISWVVAKPQYGAFAIPLAVLFVFSLLSQVLYVSAAITAGASDDDRSLAELEPVAAEDVPDTPLDTDADTSTDTDDGGGSDQETAQTDADPARTDAG
jgi:membrane protein